MAKVKNTKINSKTKAKPKLKLKPNSEGNRSNAKISATKGSNKKISLILGEIRGLQYPEATAYLRFSPKGISSRLLKLLESCRANFEYKHGRVDDSRLWISKTYCTPGPALKRFQPKSMGRAGRILKRTSNINIELLAK